MNYAEARNKFSDGDIVFIASGKKDTLLRKIIRWFTKGPHHHVGIAFWVTDGVRDRLMISEAVPGGYRIVNLGYYQDCDMTVFKQPVPWKLVEDKIMSSTGTVEYDFLDFVFIGLHERFGLPIPNITGRGEICSVIVSKILQSAGLKEISTMVSPQRLCEELSSKVSPAAFFVQGKK